MVRMLSTMFALLAALSGPALADGGDVRLNRMIGLWAGGQPAFGTFVRFRDADGAIHYAQSGLDFVIFDLEHGAADFSQFRVFLQFMTDKAQLLKKGNLQPDVVPIARVPGNGGERNQWTIKQALDAGAFGLMAPHVATVEEARHLVASSRYTQALGAVDALPRGERGVAPGNAARHWGLAVAEYMKRADAWPLDPAGELAVIAMIESGEGVRNVREMLTGVPGISAIFIGPNDLSTALGYPGQTRHPETEKAVQQVLRACLDTGVPCGILVTRSDIEQRVREGFRYLVIAGSPADIEAALALGRQAAGR
jgi:4-hydroxy-2-oxoheptanedioate aldolase